MSQRLIAELSAAEARRVALAAQGFSASPRLRKRRPFDPALERMHVLQIDSVNVFARSHYLPVFSRHGAYAPDALDDLLMNSGEYTEYWAHEATFLPVEDRPLFAWRMEDYRRRYEKDGRAGRFGEAISRVRDALADRGPSLVRDLEPDGPREKRGPWWDWSDTKRAVEMMFAWGEAASAGRRGFQRRYALAPQVLPEGALEVVPRRDAQRILVERAGRSLGVATLADLADYYRLPRADAAAAVRDLEEEGVLTPVKVEGWGPASAWLHRDARVPTRLPANALLTPFDPLVWFRSRTERIFDFHYRIEIYTPKHKRQYGYYCLPLLVGGRLVGRIDLKADRAAQALLAQAAWHEPQAPPRTAEVARDLLRQTAQWQGLESIVISGIGNLDLSGV